MAAHNHGRKSASEMEVWCFYKDAHEYSGLLCPDVVWTERHIAMFLRSYHLRQ